MGENVQNRGCLDGVRVIEFAQFQAGPRAGMTLADLGAEVIKIERPGGEETRNFSPVVRGESVYFAVYNRGKKSVVVDLRTAEGLELVRRLLETADIVLENFKPGTMERLGLGFDAVRALKPDIIYASVSGYGQQGPYTDRPGFDPVGQAMTGLMDLTGQREGKPIMTAFSLVDRTTALHATIGILGALYRRGVTGKGEHIDVCLLDSGYSMVEIPAIVQLETGGEGGERGRPAWKAADGWVVIMAATPRMLNSLEKLLSVKIMAPIGPATLDEDDALKAALSEWCAERPVDTICTELTAAGVVVVPVRTVAQAVEDPHPWARRLFVKVEGANTSSIYAPGLPIKFSNAKGTVGPVPGIGAHTQQVLTELGYDQSRIAMLRDSKVVAWSETRLTEQ